MKRILKGIGTVATIASLILIIGEIRELDFDISFFSGNNLLLFLLFVIVYTGLVTMLGIPWGMYVSKITGRELPKARLNLVFTRSNLMKYIPGNIFQYVGRNEIAIDYELNHKDVVWATILDVVTLASSGLLIAVIFSLQELSYYLLQYVDEKLIIFAVIVIFLLVVIFLCIINKKSNCFSYLFEKKVLLALCKGIGLLIIFHLCSATMFGVTLIEVIGVDVQAITYAKVIGAWCVGYLVGYVVPGSPGGLGVRELTIALLLSNVVDVSVVTLGTVFMRFANIIGEVLAFMIALLVELVKKRMLYNKGKIMKRIG